MAQRNHQRPIAAAAALALVALVGLAIAALPQSSNTRILTSAGASLVPAAAPEDTTAVPDTTSPAETTTVTVELDTTGSSTDLASLIVGQASSLAIAKAAPQVVTGAGKVTKSTVTGPDGAVRTLVVYHPAVSDQSVLPVLYFLHGLPGSAQNPFSAGMAAALDEAFRNGAAPFIVASVDGNGTTHDDTEWADSVDGVDLIESGLIQAAIPAVEGDHPRTSAQRAIAGFSMGGYGAMNLALRHPDLFGQVVAMAGYFHVDDPDGMFADDPTAIAANSPDQHASAAVGMRVLLADGTGDTSKLFKGEAVRMGTLLSDEGVDVTVSITDGGHSWAWVQSQYPAVIDFLEQGWA